MIGKNVSNGWKNFEVDGVAHDGRGWKPHLRKWRDACPEGVASLPEVRHLAAPGRVGARKGVVRRSKRTGAQVDAPKDWQNEWP